MTFQRPCLQLSLLLLTLNLESFLAAFSLIYHFLIPTIHMPQQKRGLAYQNRKELVSV